jgi:SAM-dependent methyltransferase
MSNTIERITYCRKAPGCRSCGNRELSDILSLGNLYISNFVDNPDVTTLRDEEAYPLELVLCEVAKDGCGLLQLRHTVSPKKMYRNYWYRSGVNKSMTDALTELANTTELIPELSAGDIVVDIGSNDSTMLRAFKHQGLRLVGFEPANNLMELAERGTTKIFNDFFSYELFAKEFGAAKAKIITAVAMFYDLDDPNTFVAGVTEALDPEGVFVIQQAYLPLMLKQNNFDNIIHEHIEYYSLYSLERLLERHNLEVFDLEQNEVNGGSFRTYIRHTGSSVGNNRSGAVERVSALRKSEEALGLQSRAIYDEFADRVEGIKKELNEFIDEVQKNGEVVYAYGASTKGNTLLQYFGLDRSKVAAAAERNPIKWGKFTIGTGIPVISEEQAREEKPDYFLVLPWHFMPEFLKRESEFLEKGGKFIVPLPEFQIIGSDNMPANPETVVFSLER